MRKIPEAASAFLAIRNYLHVTRRALAQTCGVDPSYVTLFERDGAAPYIDTALSMADAMANVGAPTALVNRWLIACGYVPRLGAVGVRRVLDACLREGAPKC